MMVMTMMMVMVMVMAPVIMVMMMMMMMMMMAGVMQVQLTVPISTIPSARSIGVVISGITIIIMMSILTAG